MLNDLQRLLASRTAGIRPMIILQAFVMFVALWQLFLFQSTLKWDAIDITLPWRYFSTDALRHGILPLWNPYQHLGFAHGTSPETWYVPGLIMGVIRGYGLYSLNVEYLFHLVIAAVGFYKLARTIGISKEGAAWGALIFPLSGFFVANSQHMGWIIAGAWTPHLFHTYLKFRRGFNWRYGMYFALTCFFMVSGGYVAISIVNAYILVILISYDFFKQTRRRIFKSSYLWQHLRLLLLTLSVSAVILVCFYELKTNIDRGAGLSDLASLKGSLYFRHLVSFIFPFPTVKGTFDLWQADQAMINMYIGLPALILLGLSLRHLKNRFYLFAWSGVIFFLTLAFGKELPVRTWFNHLPLFDLFRFPSLFRYYVVLISLLIGGRVLTDYLSVKPEVFSNLLKRGSLYGALFFMVITIAFFLWNRDIIWEAVQLNIPDVWEAFALQAILHTAMLSLFFLVLRYGPGHLSTYAILMLFTGMDMVVATQLNGRVSIFSEGPLASAQSCIESLPQGYPLPETADHIGSNLDRGLHHAYLYRNTNTLYKRIGWDGYTPFQYKDYITLEKSDLFSKTSLQPALYISLYKPRDSTRNYFESFPDPQLTRNEMRISGFSPNRVDLQTNSEVTRILVYNQNLTSGWKGFADGEEIPVLKTDIGLAGFMLPEGPREVTLVYRPGNLINSLMISGLFVSILVVISLLMIFRSYPLTTLLVLTSSVLTVLICYKPPGLMLPKFEPGRSLINLVDELPVSEVSDNSRTGRFMDRSDLPRFQQMADNIEKPFTYFQRDLCTSQSDVFLQYLNEQYQISDTLATTSYHGYEVTEKPIVKKPIFETIHRFEGHLENWQQTDENVLADAKGNRFQDITNLTYGATFTLQSDTMISLAKIDIDVDIQYFDQNQIRLICSLDSDGENQLYESYQPTNNGKEGWQRKTWPFDVNQNITHGTILKIYVWNPDHCKCMIDNFHIRGY